MFPPSFTSFALLVLAYTLFVLSFPSFTFSSPFFVSHVFLSFISCCFLSSSLSHLPSFFLIFHFLCSIALSPTFIFCFLLFVKSISCPLVPPFGSNLPLLVLSCYFTFLPALLSFSSFLSLPPHYFFFSPFLLFLCCPATFLATSSLFLPLDIYSSLALSHHISFHPRLSHLFSIAWSFHSSPLLSVFYWHC